MSEQNPENTQVTETPEELTKKIAELQQERDNVVGELKDDRQKRQQLQDEVENLKQSLTEATKTNLQTDDQNDISAVVEAAIAKKLAEEKASVAKGNREAAIEQFVNENPAFKAENDPTGKRREALVSKVKMFNTEGLQTKEQFYSVVRDAFRLLGTDTVPTDSGESVENPYASTTQSSGTPRVTTANGLTEKENKLVQANGWTKEKFVALREKNPEYVDNLLSYVK